MVAIPPSVDALIRELPFERREHASILVRNHLRWFESLSTSGSGWTWGHDGRQTWYSTFRVFGHDWVEKYLGTMIWALRDLVLYDMIRFEISTGPVHDTSFGRYIYETGPYPPQTKLCFTEIQLRMATRRTKGAEGLSAFYSDTPMNPDDVVQNLKLSFESTYDEIQRDVLCDLLTTGETNGVVKTPIDKLMDELERQSAIIHRRSIAGPTNRIVTSGELARTLPIKGPQKPKDGSQIYYRGCLNDQWEVYVDPLFPEKKLTTWHHTPETGHVGYTFVLFLLGFFNHIGGLTLRYGKRLLRPEFYATLEVV